jgi:hypothetical protein
MGEKERFEILLEEIRHDVRIIAEGHNALLQEMSRGFGSLKAELSELSSMFELYAKQTNKRLELLEAR